MVKWYGVLLMIRFQNNSFTCSFLRKSVAMLWIALWLGQHKCASGKSTSSLGTTQKKLRKYPSNIQKLYSASKKKSLTQMMNQLSSTHIFTPIFSLNINKFSTNIYTGTKLIRSSITTISWLQKSTKTLKTFDMGLDFSWIKNKVFYSSRCYPL